MLYRAFWAGVNALKVGYVICGWHLKSSGLAMSHAWPLEEASTAVSYQGSRHEPEDRDRMATRLLSSRRELCANFYGSALLSWRR